MKSSIVVFVISLFLFAASVSARAGQCGLTIFGIDGENSVGFVKATATSLKNKRLYNAVPGRESSKFSAVPEGKLTIHLSKKGYQRSVAEFVLDCQGTNQINVSMKKGSAVKIFRAEVSDVTYDIAEDVDAGAANQGRYDPTPSGRQVLNGNATNLAKPPYPAAARAVRASGAVNVQVTIDETGKVISAFAISGHPLLRSAAVEAAKASTFSPTLLDGQPVKITGVIVYNFVP